MNEEGKQKQPQFEWHGDCCEYGGYKAEIHHDKSFGFVISTRYKPVKMVVGSNGFLSRRKAIREAEKSLISLERKLHARDEKQKEENA